MIHDVKIFKPGGEVRIVTAKELKDNHWRDFKNNGDLRVNHDRGIQKNINRAKARKKVK